jgi:hypothetical protein
MYQLILILHSWIRWIALLAGFIATFQVIAGRPDNDTSDRWGLIFMISLDLQLLLGLILYLGLSPATAAVFSDFGAAMRDPVARFWAVEHVTTMLGAVIAAHVGRVLARKARTPESRRARLLIAYGVGTFLLIVGIPWPGFRAGRPFFRV